MTRPKEVLSTSNEERTSFDIEATNLPVGNGNNAGTTEPV